jgi:ubiquinone/menaquinone biosynthesis C-methylase UbiE
VRSAYDAAAPSFGCHRALPDSVVEAVRSAILAAIDGPPRPFILDLGAGTGRIGSPFAAAGDDYVGVDLSFGMLQAFAERAGSLTRLVQADGLRLPFRDEAFDAVLLIHMFGGMRSWRALLCETRRVLRPRGLLVIGRSVAPEDGVDARMKQSLSEILHRMGVLPDSSVPREDVQRWLEANAGGGARICAATWHASRTPRGFLDRHRTGARFAALSAPIKQHALEVLSAWASKRFGSLDTSVCESHVFELQIFCIS